MTWQDEEEVSDRDRDRDEDRWRRPGRPGGDWHGLRPTIDNPFSWSFRIMRIAGVSVRVHMLFLLFVVAVIAQAIVAVEGRPITWLGAANVSVGLAVLFGLVLAHEFGHCLACRWTGGVADEILAWPLGGLACCRPRNQWRSHLLSALGGPLVNLVICAVAATWLGLLTGRWLGVALPNPLLLYETLRDNPVIRESWSLTILFLINWCSLVLLVFNLLPLFPLDGGRIFQALTWPRLGYVRSMRLAVYVGYVVAIAIGLAGPILQKWGLLAIAVFGGFVCYDTQRKLQFTEQVFAGAADDLAAAAFDEDGGAGAAEAEAAEQQRREQAASHEIDRILAKIADAGMDSLTGRERKLLGRETKRRRDEESG